MMSDVVQLLLLIWQNKVYFQNSKYFTFSITLSDEKHHYNNTQYDTTYPDLTFPDNADELWSNVILITNKSG